MSSKRPINSTSKSPVPPRQTTSKAIPSYLAPTKSFSLKNNEGGSSAAFSIVDATPLQSFSRRHAQKRVDSEGQKDDMLRDEDLPLVEQNSPDVKLRRIEKAQPEAPVSVGQKKMVTTAPGAKKATNRPFSISESMIFPSPSKSRTEDLSFTSSSYSKHSASNIPTSSSSKIQMKVVIPTPQAVNRIPFSISEASAQHVTVDGIDENLMAAAFSVVTNPMGHLRLKIGDHIVKINGLQPKSPKDAKEKLIRLIQARRTIELDILREPTKLGDFSKIGVSDIPPTRSLSPSTSSLQQSVSRAESTANKDRTESISSHAHGQNQNQSRSLSGRNNGSGNVEYGATPLGDNFTPPELDVTSATRPTEAVRMSSSARGSANISADLEGFISPAVAKRESQSAAPNETRIGKSRSHIESTERVVEFLSPDVKVPSQSQDKSQSQKPTPSQAVELSTQSWRAYTDPNKSSSKRNDSSSAPCPNRNNGGGEGAAARAHGCVQKDNVENKASGSNPFDAASSSWINTKLETRFDSAAELPNRQTRQSVTQPNLIDQSPERHKRDDQIVDSESNHSPQQPSEATSSIPQPETPYRNEFQQAPTGSTSAAATAILLDPWQRTAILGAPFISSLPSVAPSNTKTHLTPYAEATHVIPDSPVDSDEDEVSVPISQQTGSTFGQQPKLFKKSYMWSDTQWPFGPKDGSDDTLHALMSKLLLDDMLNGRDLAAADIRGMGQSLRGGGGITPYMIFAGLAVPSSEEAFKALAAAKEAESVREHNEQQELRNRIAHEVALHEPVWVAAPPHVEVPAPHPNAPVPRGRLQKENEQKERQAKQKAIQDRQKEIDQKVNSLYSAALATREADSAIPSFDFLGDFCSTFNTGLYPVSEGQIGDSVEIVPNVDGEKLKDLLFGNDGVTQQQDEVEEIIGSKRPRPTSMTAMFKEALAELHQQAATKKARTEVIHPTVANPITGKQESTNEASLPPKKNRLKFMGAFKDEELVSQPPPPPPMAPPRQHTTPTTSAQNLISNQHSHFVKKQAPTQAYQQLEPVIWEQAATMQHNQEYFQQQFMQVFGQTQQHEDEPENLGISEPERFDEIVAKNMRIPKEVTVVSPDTISATQVLAILRLPEAKNSDYLNASPLLVGTWKQHMRGLRWISTVLADSDLSIDVAILNMIKEFTESRGWIPSTVFNKLASFQGGLSLLFAYRPQQVSIQLQLSPHWVAAVSAQRELYVARGVALSYPQPPSNHHQ